MKTRVCCLIACLLWLASGCTVLKTALRGTDEKDADRVEDVLRYFEYVNHLAEPELSRQYVLYKERYKREDNAKNSLRFALLLTIPGTQFYDSSHAITVLNRLVSSSPPEYVSMTKLASLLLSMMTVQKNHEFRVTQMHQKLQKTIKEKDQKKRLYEATSQKLNGMVAEIKRQESLHHRLSEELEKEKQRVEDLQRQIDQLKMIEEIIDKRKNRKEPTT